MAKSKQVYRDPNVELALLVVIALTLFFVAITLPVSDKKDVYIDFAIQKGLLASPQFVDVSARVQPSTILEVPEFMGAVWGVQAGDVTVIASTTTTSKRVVIGTVTAYLDAKKRITLKSIPKSEATVKLELYEGQTLKETKVINI
jgi:hypothetical protein